MFENWDKCVDPKTSVATLDCLPIVFKNIVTAAIILSGVVALFMIIFSGMRYISSSGDPKAVEAAKGTLTWAIIGLIVILLSFFILTFISSFTGVTCIKMFGFDNCK